MSSTLRAATRQVEAGRDLTTTESELALAALLADGTDPDLVAGFLTAMAAKRPTADELVGAVRHLRGVAAPIAYDGPALDVVGTGGDGSSSINISTIAALVAAASGATVAKVGNRAATSRCGSADVLEALGIALEGGDDVPTRLRRDGFAFLFSRAVHPALTRVAALRRRLRFPTILNLVGPLSNPVQLSARLLGAATRADQVLLAQATAQLGDGPTWVVTGHGGTDELTTAGPAHIIAVSGGRTREFTVDPAELGLAAATADELIGGNPIANARVARDVLAGRGTRAVRETCLLNAAAALHIAGLGDDLTTSLDLAVAALTDGAGTRLLDRITVRADALLLQPDLCTTL